MTEPMPEPTDHLPATRRAALQALAKDFEDLAVQGLERMATRAAVGVIVLAAERYPEHDTTEPTAEPTDAWSPPPGMPLVLMEGVCTPGGLPVHRINGQDVPPSVLSAVRAASRAWAVEVREVREDLRQQKLRQKLAEREVTDLRAEVERLQGERAELLGILRSNRPEADEVRQVRAERRETLAALVQAAAEVERLRGLLGEALDGWHAIDIYRKAGPDFTGEDADEIARIRREAGLT